MEERVMEMRMEIARVIREPTIVQLLVPHVISTENAIGIKKLYDVSSERANHRLIDALMMSSDPGKWQALVDALTERGYHYLVQRLRNKVPMQEYESKLLDIFLPAIATAISPNELIPRLYANNVIDEIDREIIQAEQDNRGAHAAAMLLLDRVRLHLPPNEWYIELLSALYDNGQEHIVDLIEPDFIIKKEKRHQETFDQENESNSTSRNDQIRVRIRKCRNEIVQLLDVVSVIDYLVPLSLSFGNRNTILEVNEGDPIKAVGMLLDNVASSNSFIHFVHSLRRAGYPYLARLLTGEHRDTKLRYLQTILQIFTPTIQYQIDPMEILSSLVQEEIIDHYDAEYITCHFRNKGPIAATMMILDRIPCRLSPTEWYIKFLQVLMKSSHKHVVEIIEPDFCQDQNYFADKLNEQNEDKTDNRNYSTDKNGDLHSTNVKKVYPDNNHVSSNKLEKEPIVDLRLHRFLHRVATELVGTQHQTMVKTFIATDSSSEDNLKEGSSSASFLEVNGGIIAQDGFSSEKNDIQQKDINCIENIRRLSKPLSVKSTDSDISQPNPRQSKNMLVHGQFGDTYDAELATTSEDEDERNDSRMSKEIRIIHSEKIRDLGRLQIKDCVAISENRLAVLYNRRIDVCDSGSFAHILTVNLKCRGSRLTAMDDGKISVWTPDTQNITVTHLEENVWYQIGWECDGNKSCIAYEDGTMYVLCSDKHVHAMNVLDKTIDIINLGEIPRQHFWSPLYAALYRSCLYVSDVDGIYCFNMSKDSDEVRHDKLGMLMWQFRDNDTEINRPLFTGLLVSHGSVTVFDKNNSAVIQIGSNSGTLSSYIESSAFTDSSVVTFRPNREILCMCLISRRYHEFKTIIILPHADDM